MRKSLVLILLILFAACGKQFDAKEFYSYPKATSVFKSFDENYVMPDGKFIEFQKRPDGYFVIVKSQNDPDKIENEYLYWSKKTNQYEPLPASFRKSGEYYRSTAMSYYAGQIYAFDHSLYYNYPEAADESIAQLEGVENLDDTLMEALGRAYFSKAESLLGDKKVGNERTFLRAENKDEYIDICKKENETYEVIRKRNPEYEVLVGNIGTKIAHDKVTAWSELKMAGFDADAAAFLEDNIYSKALIAYAKNLLNSCPDNAILFTFGDSDTFPLWYVQEKINWRKDVAVINTSLINLPHYLLYSKKQHRLSTTLSDDFYQHRSSEVALFNNGVFKTSPPAVRDELLSMEQNYKSLGENKNEYVTIPDRIMALSNPKALQDSSYWFEINFDFKNPYLMRSEIFQLDLIQNHFSERAICFSQLYQNTILKACDRKNLIGMVQCIDPKKPVHETEIGSFLIDPYLNHALYKEKFILDFDPEDLQRNSHFLDAYYVFYTQTAEAYLSEQDSSKAKMLIEELEQKIPVKELKDAEMSWFRLATFYFNIGELQKSSEYCKSILNSVERALQQHLAEDESVFYLIKSGMLKDIISKINQKQLQSKYQELEQNYYSRYPSTINPYSL
ncbi:MAG: hypothetical protein K1X56_06385 [Flavobacteriales bacterium]|nr:hypothetical protein [Flavobacteriales bacterium]